MSENVNILKICLLFIFADQVFIDPTFSGIFVCGPLQSFVVNVCTRMVSLCKKKARQSIVPNMNVVL